MRGKDLLECMEHIDDALIQEALEPAAYPHGTSFVVSWGMAAACVVVIGISATAFWAHQNISDKRFEVAGENTAAPMAMDTAADDNGSTGNASGSSLTAGAVAEDTLEDVAGMEQTAHKDSESGMDNQISEDISAESASGRENAAVQELEEKVKELAEEESTKLKYTIISDYYDEKDDSVYDYPVPEKGQYLCHNDLQETMEYYAALENTADIADRPIYAYEVVIDIFGDIEISGCRGIHYEQLNLLDNSDTGNEIIEQEYRRLTELGYAVRLSEDFQLTGIFTKEELDTFQASPEYGYTFRFTNEN